MLEKGLKGVRVLEKDLKVVKTPGERIKGCKELLEKGLKGVRVQEKELKVVKSTGEY